METFSALLALCAGNPPITGEFPHKGQWRGALMFSLICAWINGLVNNREDGDFRHHRAHYDVIVMFCSRQYRYTNVNASQFSSNSIVGQQRVWVIDKRNIKARHYCPICEGIHWWPVDSRHKGRIMRKGLSCDNVLVFSLTTRWYAVDPRQQF